MNNRRKNVSCLSSHDALLSVLRPFRPFGAEGGRKCCLIELEGVRVCGLAAGRCGGGEEVSGGEKR